jgi:predicted nuclease of predicted toxin-antitoxin system
LDECVPRTLKRELPEWEVVTVREHGWASKLDGEVLRAADAEFDVLVTVDRRLVHQQNPGTGYSALINENVDRKGRMLRQILAFLEYDSRVVNEVVGALRKR